MQATIIALLLMLATAAHGQALPQTIEAEEELGLRSAERRGLLMFRHDHAAAVATDAVLKVRGFKRDKRLRGWITESRADEILVTFFGVADDELVALYRVTVDAEGEVLGKAQRLKRPEPLTEFELAAAKARTAALGVKIDGCVEKYNSVVLPMDGDLQRWRVYLLPATTRDDIVPIGGTFRIELDMATGMSESRPFTKSCIQLPKGPEGSGLMITHMLDPMPTEAHVFWSIWSGKAIFVSTEQALWSVEGAQISLLSRHSDEAE